MQKKIYVAPFDAGLIASIEAAVKAVAGVTNCVASPDKCQVCVDFDGADEGAINSAISSVGVDVLG